MTKNHSLFAAAAALALVAVSGTASAQPGDRPEPPTTRAEAIERALERFAERDVNEDGFVSMDEAQEAREERRARRFEAMFSRHDTNDDGFLSEDEVAARAGSMFDRIDTDGDGVLSEDERDAMKERRGGRRGGRRG